MNDAMNADLVRNYDPPAAENVYQKEMLSARCPVSIHRWAAALTMTVSTGDGP